MPGGNGIEFLEAVRETRPDLPFVLYTGKGSEEVASDAISAGVTDYLQKERGTDQYAILANRIRNAVEQTRAEEDRDRMELALEHTGSVIFELDLDTGAVVRHGAFEQFLDLPANEVPTWQDYLDRAVHPDDREGFRRFYRQLVDRDRDGGTIEYRTHPDRERGRWIRDTVSVHREGADDPRQAVGIAQDITAYKERERELRRKERERDLERIHEFFTEAERLGDLGAWEFDATGASTWTEGTRRIHEVDGEFDPTVEDGIGFYHPEDRDTVRNAVERALEHGEPYDVEVRLITAGGTERWVRTRGKPTDESDGTTTVRGYIQDITAQKERERELERYERLIETLPIGYGRTTLDGDVVATNSTFVAMVDGESEDDVLARDVEEFYRDATTRERLLTTLRERGQVRDEEVKVTTLAGETIWTSITARVVDDEGTRYVDALVQDVTDRKEYERELERRTERWERATARLEEQYRTLFEEAPVMAVLTRDEEGRPIVEDCNDQFADVLEHDRETVVGTGLAEFYTPGSRERLIDDGGYRRSLAGTFTRECRDLLTADGEVVETLLRAVPRRDASGEVVGTLAMYLDITEREQIRRANERLEAFTSIVSHDLRNPLNVAEGRLELAREEYDSDHLDGIANAHDRMKALIDDLLTLAREGEQVGDVEPVDLDDIAENCWENVETADATLVTDLDRSVRADPGRLRQLLENLMRNAVEHGSTGGGTGSGDAAERGSTGVSVTVGELDDGFYVADDGPGIAPDDRDRVFDAGHSTSEEGTGFGLSIVEQIAEAHGWSVRVTEGVDGGARFEITGVEVAAE